MEQEKPFKSIEVIDSSTGQTCKIACMSCIRGHRTTSCGIPVCRTKIFWTVKRPGRPSNSCTCRFGPTGRCQCVVAKSACPHKPKRGEKRSVDCRCDEQGRYCCILEAEHWDALTALQQPRVEFHSTREDLENARVPAMNVTYPPTPAHTVSTPQTVNSLPNTPGQANGMQSFDSPVSAHQSPFSVPTRMGMMGMGLPMGSQGHESKDLLTWDGQAPQAPQPPPDYSMYSGFAPVDNMAMPHAAPALAPDPAMMPFAYMPQANQPYHGIVFGPTTESYQSFNMPPPEPQPTNFDYDKMVQDYINYQFPSAICQNCGLNGCTCKNCPAVMQNSSTGSWAQCCSRKHTRMADIQPPAPIMQQMNDLNMNYDTGPGNAHFNSSVMQPDVDQQFSQTFGDSNLDMSGQDPVDISDFLMTDLERPTHGCCCGGES